jgi:tRNA(Ile)-lysidine synthase TilS/MesJ
MARFIARASYGNDSIAMLQLMADWGLKDVVVTYSDTGWASAAWEDRVVKAEAWVQSLGWEAVRISSVGFEQNVKNQTASGMFPTRLRKHCTKYLKILPFLKWVAEFDPAKTATICVGVRRAESEDRRAAEPFLPEKDDGRNVWHPLVEVSNEGRDGLVIKAGFEVLPHRSDECAVCINATRLDLRRASDASFDRIEALEDHVGRPMFNPQKFMGAEGIREVRRWAQADRGKYIAPGSEQPATETEPEPREGSCEDDWCGI